MQKTLTIFTTTYNRAYRLHECYESLVRQNCKDFLWLIVDDGSTDSTHDLVQSWKEKENGFEIQYIYQENGGPHTANNLAYRMITTELNLCVDSDDYLTDNAVEIIINFWKANKSDQVAGIIALDVYRDGTIIGTELPKQREIHLQDYYRKGGSGDKKMIYRTKVIKEYPENPVFEGEKFIGNGYKYMLIDQDYPLLVLNKPICVVEYLEDGYTKNTYKLYVENPKGYAFVKGEQLRFEKQFSYKLKFSVQFIAFSLFAKNWHFLDATPNKVLTVCSFPLGVALYCYIRLKAR